MMKRTVAVLQIQHALHGVLKMFTGVVLVMYWKHLRKNQQEAFYSGAFSAGITAMVSGAPSRMSSSFSSGCGRLLVVFASRVLMFSKRPNIVSPQRLPSFSRSKALL